MEKKVVGYVGYSAKSNGYMSIDDASGGYPCISHYPRIYLKIPQLAQDIESYNRIYKEQTNIVIKKLVMEDVPESEKAPYGHCPMCGAIGVERERRPDGDDTCAKGHVYPSRLADGKVMKS